MNNEFDKYIKQLNDAYLINSKKTLEEARNSLISMGIYEKEEKNIKSYKRINIILAILILLLGLVPPFNPLYLFGYFFFLAGWFLNIYGGGGKECLIFLFSHGGVGLGCMLLPMIFNINNIPQVLIFVIISLILVLAGMLIITLRVLSSNISDKPSTESLPTLLCFIGITIITILSKCPNLFNDLLSMLDKLN